MDPYAVAAAQTQSNKDTAGYLTDLNRINQTTPLGSLTYNKTPGAATYDNNAYQSALAAWKANGGQGAASQPGPSGFMPGFNSTYGSQGASGAPANTSGGSGAMPTIDQFKTGEGAPTWSSNISLTPDLQASLDAQTSQDKSLNQFGNSLIPQIQNSLSKGYDTSSLPALRGGANGGSIQTGLNYSSAPALPGGGDFSADRTKVENALYSRIDPKLQQNEDDLRNRLANQGIQQGSEAYDREINDMNQAKNDAYNQAILAGGQEQSRLSGLAMDARQESVNETNNQGTFANSAQNQAYNQDFQNAQLSNAARAQGLQEQSTIRSQPLNDLFALRSGTPIQTPQFGAPYQANMNPTDVQGAMNTAYAGQQNAYNQQVASGNSLQNGLFSLAGTLGTAYLSDARLKEDITHVGETSKGIKVYRYRFKGSNIPQVGVLAQEVEKIIPAAVTLDASGFKKVNYAMVR